MHAVFGHVIAKMIPISFKLFREEQLGLVFTAIQDTRVSLISRLDYSTEKKRSGEIDNDVQNHPQLVYIQQNFPITCSNLIIIS